MINYVKRNFQGKLLQGHKELIKPEYGTGEIDRNGEPIVNWNCLSKWADEDGFDTRKLISENRYIVEELLPRGFIIIRYGSEMGRFTAPDGTDYEKLSLPYKKDTIEFHRYKIISDGIKVYCIVNKGFVAPGFNSDGGAIQYLHKKTIYDLLKQKVIERIQ